MPLLSLRSKGGWGGGRSRRGHLLTAANRFSAKLRSGNDDIPEAIYAGRDPRWNDRGRVVLIDDRRSDELCPRLQRHAVVVTRRHPVEPPVAAEPGLALVAKRSIRRLRTWLALGPLERLECVLQGLRLQLVLHPVPTRRAGDPHRRRDVPQVRGDGLARGRQP